MGPPRPREEGPGRLKPQRSKGPMWPRPHPPLSRATPLEARRTPSPPESSVTQRVAGTRLLPPRPPQALGSGVWTSCLAASDQLGGSHCLESRGATSQESGSRVQPAAAWPWPSGSAFSPSRPRPAEAPGHLLRTSVLCLLMWTSDAPPSLHVDGIPKPHSALQDSETAPWDKLGVKSIGFEVP